MKCVVCKVGTVRKNKRTTLKFEKGGSLLLVKNVPADVCDTCGEAYMNQRVTGEVLSKVRFSLQKGVELEVITMNPKGAFV